MFKSLSSLVVALLAIAAAAVPARADVFDYTGIIQTYTVATTGIYTITSAGAQGGSSDFGGSGGLGAVISGNVLLTANTVLDIVVGQEGSNANGTLGGGGGGGGSFVYEPLASQPLEAAGGGGGTGWFGQNGSDASAGTAGGNGQGSGGAGGTSGGGGSGASSYGTLNGGGGAGWIGNGSGGSGRNSGGGGLTSPFWAGGAGGAAGDGGYGGGGGGGNNAGGGGGGYSGGGGGDGQGNYGGGGGGSYIDSLFIGGTTSIAISQTGNGLVTITPDFSATPEPGSVLLLGSAAILLGLTLRSKWRRPPAETIRY